MTANDFGGLPRAVPTGTVLLLHNLSLQEIESAFDLSMLLSFCLSEQQWRL